MMRFEFSSILSLRDAPLNLCRRHAAFASHLVTPKGESFDARREGRSIAVYETFLLLGVTSR
jgi:hypothetical protein